MKLRIYTVWTCEDSDFVELFTDKTEAEKTFEEYGEFGRWQEDAIDITNCPIQLKNGDFTLEVKKAAQNNGS